MAADAARSLICITARGGSKGLPGKNLIDCGGVPLITHAIRAACEVRDRVHRVIVSTDDEEIAEVAREFGAEVPFVRPAALATDDATSVDVAIHALREIERSDAVRLQGILLIQPTNPLVIPADLVAVLDRAADPGVDSVVTVSKNNHFHPRKAKRVVGGWLRPWGDDPSEPTRRQDLAEDAWFRNGSCYWARRELLVDRGLIYGDRLAAVEVPRDRCVDIDDELDLYLARCLLRRQLAEGE